MGKDSAPNRHSHLLGDRRGLVLTILALCCHLQNHTSNSQKHGGSIHIVFSKFTIFVSVPITVILSGVHPLTWTSLESLTGLTCEPDTLRRQGNGD